jgi:hypothetical protein|tara:strand:+ start:612 stop:1301 length:690 start_codon:yes stop_codon:yes gene_type:complete
MVKKFKDFDMDKHVIDTLNKYEDKPDIIVEEVIRKSPVPVPGYEGGATPKRKAKPYNAFDELVKQNKKEEEVRQKNKKNFTAKPDPSKGIIKPFDNLNPASYPVNQKEDLSMWDMMKKSARNEIKKGNYSEMQRIKDTLNDDYKRSGGQWMNDEEKKLIGKYKPKYNSEPMKFDINLDITQSRLHLEKRREEAERMKQEIDSDRKIFEKKIRRGENQGLAYLIDPKEKY